MLHCLLIKKFTWNMRYSTLTMNTWTPLLLHGHTWNHNALGQGVANIHIILVEYLIDQRHQIVQSLSEFHTCKWHCRNINNRCRWIKESMAHKCVEAILIISLCKLVLHLHKNSQFNLGVLILICSTYKCNLKDIMN